MSDHEDLIEIDLDADDKSAAEGKKDDKGQKTAKKDDVEVVETAKPGKVGAAAEPTPDQVVEKLKKDLATERTARAAAEKKARDESAARAASESEVGTTQLQLVTTAIESTKSAASTLKEKYAAALAAQDFAAAADINEEIADNRARLLQLENGKSAMEDEAKRAKEQPRRVEISDPVEKLASQLTAPSADWVRSHPEYARDPRKNRQMIRAHEDVLDEGITADTPEYFAEIEKKLGIGHSDDTPDVEVVAEAAKPTGGRRISPAAAPVSNSGGATGARPGRATLTKEEMEIAEMNGMTAREYYDSKQALKKAGRLN